MEVLVPALEHKLVLLLKDSELFVCFTVLRVTEGEWTRDSINANYVLNILCLSLSEHCLNIYLSFIDYCTLFLASQLHNLLRGNESSFPQHCHSAC